MTWLRVLLVPTLLGMLGLVVLPILMGFADAGFNEVEAGEDRRARTEIDARAYVDSRFDATCEVTAADGSTTTIDVGEAPGRSSIGLSGDYVDGPATISCDRAVTLGRDPGPLVALGDRPWLLAVPMVLLGGGALLLGRALRAQRRDGPASARAWELPPG
ncbi:hypothetical protein [Nocardioides litoris]|uniref:hypothetical protein n=1 Tax=Nocardioides litoris TaxID=1926648 RepID=UPI0011228872|nr:hypothetical protein [Nocardioides litoris]